MTGMKIAIMQPTYLPWIGYFDLMDQVDRFVLLDNVQFVKQSWQQRNRIKTPKGLEWLTLPVSLRGRFGQQINEVGIREPGFWEKHLKALECNYRRSPFFSDYFDGLRKTFQEHGPWLKLVDVNTTLIAWLAKELGIMTPVVVASSLEVDGKRTAKLVRFCKVLGAGSYLSPIGAAGYLVPEIGEFVTGEIEVRFHHYQHPVYRQLFGQFLPHATALDLLFNEGPAASEIMRSGRRTALAAAELPVSVLEGEIGDGTGD